MKHILAVDDEPYVLEFYQQVLHPKYSLTTTTRPTDVSSDSLSVNLMWVPTNYILRLFLFFKIYFNGQCLMRYVSKLECH